MGRQLNFFLMPNDMSLLETHLRKVGLLSVVGYHSDGPQPQILTDWSVSNNKGHWLVFLARATDLDSIVLRKVEKQGYWSVDALLSPVVSMHVCFFNGEILRRGRLYYTVSFYNSEDVRVTKPAEFEQWAERIFSAAKKVLIYDKNRSVYIGADAHQWMNQPGKQAIFAKGGLEMILQ